MHDLLAKLPGAPEPIREACAPTMLELLCEADPPILNALSQALEAVLTVPSVDLSRLDGIFEERCRSHVGSPERFGIWWTAWSMRNSDGALGLLEELVGSLPADTARGLVLQAFDRLYHWTEMYSAVSPPIPGDLHALKRLIPIAYSLVDPEDDLRHENVFSPGVRDHAQTIRNRLVPWMASIEGDATVEAFQELANDERLKKYKDYLLAQADDRTANNEPCAPMSKEEGQAWSKGFRSEVRTSADLFEVAQNRVADARLFIEQHDHSYRAMFTALQEHVLEDHAQKWLATELGRTSANQYSVTREEEADRGKKPDLRLHNPVCEGPVSIEVKVAERWSFNELVEALKDQLVGQYLAAVNSTHGVLLLCAMGVKEHWRDDDRNRYTFPELVDKLNELARDIVAENPAVDGLVVIGIDFH